MSPHTSGEWFVNEKGFVYARKYYALSPPFQGDDGRIITGHYSGLIALPYSQGDGSAEGNAHLIAAAPDLLASLIELRERHQIDDPHHAHLCAFCKKADAAIAKAKGYPPVGSYVIYTAANQSETKNVLGLVVEGGVDCIDSLALNRLDRDGLSPLSNWDSVERFEMYTPWPYELFRSHIAVGHTLERAERMYLQYQSGKGIWAANDIIDLHLSTFDEF